MKSKKQKILTHDIDIYEEGKEIEIISFSDKLWIQCLQTKIPHTALETKFFKGIKNGTLSIDSYGPYFIQDIAYLQHGSETWAHAAVQAHQQNKVDIAEYCKERSRSWAKYAKQYAEEWHIKYDGIILDDIVKQYTEYERYIINKYGVEYIFIAFYSCLKLWPFIANELKKLQQNQQIDDSAKLSENNVYQFWIEYNIDDKSAVQNNKWLDILYNQNRIDEEIAFDIVCNCLKLEINWFKIACNEKANKIKLYCNTKKEDFHYNPPTKQDIVLGLDNIMLNLPQNLIRARSV